MRIKNWQSALIEQIERWRIMPFKWGQSDCLSFCIACEWAITGASRMDDLPVYRTEAGAARKLKALGFASVAALVADRCPEVAPALARRGDWVMVEGLGLLPGSFGVVVGQRFAVMGLSGLQFLPMTQVQRAWTIE